MFVNASYVSSFSNRQTAMTIPPSTMNFRKGN
jgi:hypothetical protein